MDDINITTLIRIGMNEVVCRNLKSSIQFFSCDKIILKSFNVLNKNTLKYFFLFT